MGRRNHLIRVALSATQNQIEEPVTPTESDDEDDNASLKLQNLQRIEHAREAVLNAIGLMANDTQQKETESGDNSLISVSTVCGIISYHLALPFLSLRNQVLVDLGLRA